ncbi:MAG: hypothetical protein ABFD69_10275 [Candidatus Sumerlaeia bacterium]
MNQRYSKRSHSTPRRILRWLLLIFGGGFLLFFGPLILIVVFNLSRPIQVPEYLRAPAAVQLSPEPTSHTLVQDPITTTTQAAVSGLIPASTLATPELRARAASINIKYAELKKYYASCRVPVPFTEGFGKIIGDYNIIHEEAKQLDERWRRQINNDFLRMMYDRGDWDMIIEFVRRWREYDNWDTAMFACQKKGMIHGGIYIAALVSEPTINRVFDAIRHHELPPKD